MNPTRLITFLVLSGGECRHLISDDSMRMRFNRRSCLFSASFFSGGQGPTYDIHIPLPHGVVAVQSRTTAHGGAGFCQPCSRLPRTKKSPEWPVTLLRKPSYVDYKATTANANTSTFVKIGTAQAALDVIVMILPLDLHILVF